jgi:hypothetical protein
MMVDSLIALCSIQRLDSELDTLRSKVDEIPRKIEGLNLTVSDEKKQLEATRARILDLKKRYKLAELDLRESDEKIAAKSGQLYGAKTNELYKAFIKEIEALRVTKNRVEEEMIVMMEELERAEHQVKTLDREVTSIGTETIERIGTLEKERAELQAAVVVREEERTNLIGTIDQHILNVYERIRKNKRGVAVVSIANDRCNGCLIPIPPQLMLEVAKKDRLHLCEHCGRVLVPPDLM